VVTIASNGRIQIRPHTLEANRLHLNRTFHRLLPLIVLIGGAVPLSAGTIFDLSGTFTDSAVLSGTVTIDTTGGTVTSLDASIGGLQFDCILAQGDTGTYYYVVDNTGGGPPGFELAIPVESLVGYAGGALSTLTNYAVDNAVNLSSGSATEAPTAPEPSTFLLLGMALAGGSIVQVRTKLVKKS
jgi:hypothetical protein